MVAPKTRIAVALLLGSALVAGALFMRAQHTTSRSLAAVALTAPAERSYIDVKDSNNDGVPDWQEALQSTDPILVSSSTSASSSYKAPTTVTGKFALTFFEDFMRSKLYSGLGATQNDLVQQETDKLAKQTQDQLFTEKDITLFTATDTPALRYFGNSVANVMLAHPSTTGADNELTILEDAVRYKEQAKLEELAPIEQAYTSMVKDMLDVPTPSQYAKLDLNLINALNAVREDVHAMHNVNEDPMYALMRLKRYRDDVLGLSNALSSLFGTLYLQDGVRFESTEPAAQLITFPK